ncbi:MAG TPA: M15 family metallopeptidase [Gammaproteobacteria bacterium]|nr:M15 family metallopeptidase [Gammaproteobacteria bacterium]
MRSALHTAEGDYAMRIADIHRQLGIPADYAATRGLPLCEEATELTDIGLDINQRMRQLTPAAAQAWQAMQQAAARDEITLLLVSAFRSVDYQRDLIARKLAKGEHLDAILRVMAAPGYSEHHTGRALDLTAPGLPPLKEAFEITTAFAWLKRHAADFDFHLSYPRDNPHGIVYEPWHWAFSGD